MAALKANAEVREIESMYKQAMWLAELKRDRVTAARIEDVFRQAIETENAA